MDSKELQYVPFTKRSKFPIVQSTASYYSFHSKQSSVRGSIALQPLLYDLRTSRNSTPGPFTRTTTVVPKMNKTTWIRRSKKAY
jgi:hypothetical protein